MVEDGFLIKHLFLFSLTEKHTQPDPEVNTVIELNEYVKVYERRETPARTRPPRIAAG